MISKGIEKDPAAKYFRNQNVSDVEFESKKRKIFKALYDIKKEIKKKQDKRVSITSIQGESTIASEVVYRSLKNQQEDEKKLKEESLLQYHNDEDFFNNVFHNHIRKTTKSGNNRYNSNLSTSQDKNNVA